MHQRISRTKQAISAKLLILVKESQEQKKIVVIVFLVGIDFYGQEDL